MLHCPKTFQVCVLESHVCVPGEKKKRNVPEKLHPAEGTKQGFKRSYGASVF
jgi:hypothetical protein